MSTTYAAARTKLRSMLREPVAKFWSDARLLEILQDADWDIYKKQQRIRKAGVGELAETVTLAADATTFSLTAGSNPTALTKALKGILWIEHQTTGGDWNLLTPMDEAEEFAYRSTSAVNATSDVPPKYRLRRPNIVFLPASTAARTLRIVYRPIPTALTDGNSTVDVDDDHVHVVLLLAAVMAYAEIGESETQYEALFQRAEDDMFADLSRVLAEGRTETVKQVEHVFNF